MPDTNTVTPPDTAKFTAVTTPPAKTDDVATSKGNGIEPSASPTTASKPRFKKFVPILVVALAALILFGISGGWNRWVGSGTQKTDDAILRADITPLSTRVSGTVVQVAVADYQRVKAGDLLVQLKDDDFKAQVAQSEAGVAAAQAALENNAKQKDLQSSRIIQAQAGIQGATAEIAQTDAAIQAAHADVANAQAGVDAAEAKIPDAQAAVAAAQADADRTQLERKRQEALLELGSATKQKLEQVVADQQRYAAILDSRKAEMAVRTRVKQDEFSKQFPNDPQRVRDEITKWREANDPGKTPLSVLIDHIDHIARVAGIDHVGLGSDFDGVPLTGVPEGMEDISKLPSITVELMKRGYSDGDIKKVLGENFLRVMLKVEQVAHGMRVTRPSGKK